MWDRAIAPHDSRGGRARSPEPQVKFHDPPRAVPGGSALVSTLQSVPQTQLCARFPARPRRGFPTRASEQRLAATILAHQGDDDETECNEENKIAVGKRRADFCGQRSLAEGLIRPSWAGGSRVRLIRPGPPVRTSPFPATGRARGEKTPGGTARSGPHAPCQGHEGSQAPLIFFGVQLPHRSQGMPPLLESGLNRRSTGGFPLRCHEDLERHDGSRPVARFAMAQ